MDQDQQQAFAEAVERKKAQAEEASEHPGRSPRAGDGVKLDPPGDAQPGIQADDRNQDALSTRQKNSGHGKKTADKWNQ
jgi:hypothetical protein